jgi:hypothetical protein
MDEPGSSHVRGVYAEIVPLTEQFREASSV